MQDELNTAEFVPSDITLDVMAYLQGGEANRGNNTAPNTGNFERTNHLTKETS